MFALEVILQNRGDTMVMIKLLSVAFYYNHSASDNLNANPNMHKPIPDLQSMSST